MITPARVKELLTLNLRDERVTSAALFIQNLIARDRYGSGIEQYRIKNLLTGKWVTSLEQFILQLDESKIRLEYPYEGERLQTDRVTGFVIRLDQYEVQWGVRTFSDQRFSNFFDFETQRHFQFMMAYMNDADEALPLKISFVKLIS